MAVPSGGVVTGTPALEEARCGEPTSERFAFLFCQELARACPVRVRPVATRSELQEGATPRGLAGGLHAVRNASRALCLLGRPHRAVQVRAQGRCWIAQQRTSAPRRQAAAAASLARGRLGARSRSITQKPIYQRPHLRHARHNSRRLPTAARRWSPQTAPVANRQPPPHAPPSVPRRGPQARPRFNLRPRTHPQGVHPGSCMTTRLERQQAAAMGVSPARQGDAGGANRDDMQVRRAGRGRRSGLLKLPPHAVAPPSSWALTGGSGSRARDRPRWRWLWRRPAKHAGVVSDLFAAALRHASGIYASHAPPAPVPTACRSSLLQTRQRKAAAAASA
jgi:hypothetical protein